MGDRKRLWCLRKAENLYDELGQLMNIMPGSSKGGEKVLAEWL